MLFCKFVVLLKARDASVSARLALASCTDDHMQGTDGIRTP